ncbi:MAG TPA: DUF2207 domain-containing protein [Thermoanaerobaculia bacterium]|nr:DUF2207 domain-containing protein [Thermoanaerobaculia bacterium]
MRLLPILILLIAGSAHAADRSLRWSRIDVTAHLDADGVLRVEEKHAIGFNGDWNGAERTFGDTLEDVLRLEHISRIDAFGRAVPLRKNKSLRRVDDYAWHESKTLRWRSRLPSDPPFRNQVITYVIAYRQSYILVPANGAHLLDHNFGLPDLEWPIDEYSLHLTLDPVWQPLGRVPQHVTRSNLRRGVNLTINAHLRHTGAGRPAAVNHGVPLLFRLALAAVLAGGAAFFAFLFIRRERGVGRFRPLVDPASIDRAWLAEHVFRFPPEVVGAAWDERTDSAEVAAVIARMVHEGKMSSRVEERGFLRRANLVLTLLRDRDTFAGYEKALVNALFIDGNTTSTEKIRAHYKTKGFDPVAKIRKPVEKKLRLIGRQGGAPKVDFTADAILAAAGFLLLAAGAFFGPLQLVGGVAGFGAILILYFIGTIGAYDYRRRVANLGAWSLEFAPAVVLLVAVPIVAADFRLSPLVLTGLVLTALGAVRGIFAVALTRDAGERLETRRRFAAAREYFARELRRPTPALDDAWFPYLLAFGLGAHIDHWFRAFGGSAAASGFGSTSSSIGTASGGTRWSGGGGAFGGAGATGSWAVAAAGMAGGISAPSSSGGGGGGGGGGSSGGGGGGGW